MDMIQHIEKQTAAVILSVILLGSCVQERIGQTPTDSDAPSPVQSVRVEPTPGGADIYYTLPRETDISYVVCEYSRLGEAKKAVASVYNDHLSVEGFLEEVETPFTLYLVDHSENRSPEYKGTFTPLEAPIRAVYKTLAATPDFGGASISWENPSQALIGAFLLARDDDGEWEEYDLVYSSLEHAKRSIRGYDDSPREFGVRLTDKFGNFSDTCVFEIRPLYEKMLDKKKFSNAHLQGDNYTTTPANPRPIENIWDGNLTNLWHTNASAGFIPPQYFSIDLGVHATLSRMVLFSRGENQYYYGQHNLRYFEVWGTHELPREADDAYWTTAAWQEGWVRLGDFEVVKPSGEPAGVNTAEDIAAQDAGFEFTFESGAEDIRYLRFVVKETWAKTAAIHICEISIYGNDGEND